MFNFPFSVAFMTLPRTCRLITAVITKHVGMYRSMNNAFFMDSKIFKIYGLQLY